MKKRFLIGALVLVLMAGCGAAFAANQSEMLVSLSYLTGTFWNDLEIKARVDVERNTTVIYQDAVKKAQSGENGALFGSFTSRTGVNGDVVSASIGFGMIWVSGNGIVRSGTLVDATAGSEIGAGGILSAGHRYLAGADVVLVVASNAAQWMEEGKWTVTAGDPILPPISLPFTDVKQGSWYYDDVSYVYQNELFYGTSSTEFSPLGKMQRCMMTTVLHRMAGEPTVSYSNLFSDIPDGQWYTKGTIWAGEKRIVAGVGNGRFNPSANITRQEIAVILYRYAVEMGYDVTARASLSSFSDAASVASWSKEAMSWAAGTGILNGSNGALRPNGDATRAEVAAMLHRFADWSGK